jgi:hypothetical protein
MAIFDRPMNCTEQVKNRLEGLPQSYAIICGVVCGLVGATIGLIGDLGVAIIGLLVGAVLGGILGYAVGKDTAIRLGMYVEQAMNIYEIRRILEANSKKSQTTNSSVSNDNNLPVM